VLRDRKSVLWKNQLGVHLSGGTGIILSATESLAGENPRAELFFNPEQTSPRIADLAED
jgi:hypothetical protein